jgi:hypothetical protein
MWVHALDILMERLQVSGVKISKVAAISGAGQVCLHDNKKSYSILDQSL